MRKLTDLFVDIVYVVCILNQEQKFLRFLRVIIL